MRPLGWSELSWGVTGGHPKRRCPGVPGVPGTEGDGTLGSVAGTELGGWQGLCGEGQLLAKTTPVLADEAPVCPLGRDQRRGDVQGADTAELACGARGETGPLEHLRQLHRSRRFEYFLRLGLFLLDQHRVAGTKHTAN